MVVLLAFGAFFVVPLAWLVLAPTKTDPELLTESPFAVGSFHNVWIAWERLDGFSGHIYRRWMENSLLYSLGATAITLATAIPAGYGLAFGGSGAQADPQAHARRDAHAGLHAGAPDLSGAECAAIDRQHLLDHLAVLVFPVRGLSRLHLLTRRPGGALDAAVMEALAIGHLPPHRNASGAPHCHRCSSLRQPTGPTSFPTRSWRTIGSSTRSHRIHISVDPTQPPNPASSVHCGRAGRRARPRQTLQASHRSDLHPSPSSRATARRPAVRFTSWLPA